MRTLQWSVARLLLLLIVVGGALILAYNFGVQQVRDTFNSLWAAVPDAPEEKRLFGLIIGGAITILGLIGLAPAPRVGPRRSITFFSGRGNVTIQLDSTYRKITRMLNRMPEVDRCTIDIVPSADGQHMVIKADARLNKLPRQRARAIAQRVSEYIADAAMNFLGLEEVVSVDLNVQDFTIDIEEGCKSLMEDAPQKSVEALGPVFAETPDVRIPAVEAEAPAFEPDLPEAVPIAEEAAEAEPPAGAETLPPLRPFEPECASAPEEFAEMTFDAGELPPLRDSAAEPEKEEKDSGKGPWPC